MKAVSYLATLPPNNKNPSKPETLKRFIQGVNRTGDQGVLHPGTNLVPSKVAFIQGWQHEHGKTANHLKLRTDVTNFQKANGDRVLIYDSNLFNYVKETNYGRFSFDGVFPTTGCYFWDQVDPLRWKKISQAHNLSLRDWRQTGNHILICTQRNGGWSMKGLGVIDWLNQTVAEIKKHTDRPIVVRPHPGDKNAKTYLVENNPLWHKSTNPNILDDLQNAWAVVVYNSTPGVAASIQGVPAFITDPLPRTSQAFGVADTDLSLLEKPTMPDRQQWIERLSMCHWSYDELSSGEAWSHFKKFV